MQSAICTLFEGDYHYGVAALTNSLYHNGFKGSVYAGYRGQLPKWTSKALDDTDLQWPGATTLNIASDLKLHFIPLETDYHFTNYKPDFLITINEKYARVIDALFYFDPDIIVEAPWSFFENWVMCGVALCEDVNSPLQENHPRRIAWRRCFGEQGFNLSFKNSLYVNGGFIGLTRSNFSFLSYWKQIQEAMALKIGGLDRSALKGNQLPKSEQGPFAPFSKTDQDALNATVENWKGEISFIGKEGMGFKPGISIMNHALGTPKPWQWKPFIQALAGRPPRNVDHNYWNYVSKPLLIHSSFEIRIRKIALFLTAFIGRFYRRGGS